jgi:hypothetical protein
MSTERATIRVLLRSGQNTTALTGDLAAAEGELTAKPGGEPRVRGVTLSRCQLDKIVLLTYPAVVGQGTRLGPGIGQDIALKLVDSRATPSE